MSRKPSPPPPKVNCSVVAQKLHRSPVARKVDRRVLHTRDVLGDALVALMHEKPFDAITVQQVLDRAGVSRSTFYAHYSGKNDLFLSDAEDFFELMATALSRHGDTSHRVAPVREFFAHVAEWHQFHSAMLAAGKLRDVLELAQGHFARAIEQRLAKSPRARGIAADRRPALAHAFAGALLSLLSWWINHGASGTPRRMDDLFHQMVWSGVGASATATPPEQIPGGCRDMH